MTVYEPLEWNRQTWRLLQCDECGAWEYLRGLAGTGWVVSELPFELRDRIERERTIESFRILHMLTSIRRDKRYARCPVCALAHATTEVL